MSFTRTVANWLSNYDNPTSVGSRFRSRRVGPLLKMIEAVHRVHGVVEIIDIGGAQRYWEIVSPAFLEAHQVNITIVNLPGVAVAKGRGRFRFLVGNGCDLQGFADQSFHIAHSNSVIEHVGDWAQMTRFASELSRVGQGLFVQTPSYWFPVEPHCLMPLFHWLPKPIRVWLVGHLQLGHWKRADSVDEAVRIVDSARLLDRRMFHALFSDTDLVTERFFGLPKSYVAMRTPRQVD